MAEEPINHSLKKEETALKRWLALGLTLVCLLLATGCAFFGISRYLTEEDGEQYLVLPISKTKVYVWDHYNEYLDQIDVRLLKAAEKSLYEQAASYAASPAFSLQTDDEGYFCLCVELIVDIDPSEVQTLPDGTAIEDGCDIDHKHVFLSERITTKIMIDESTLNT